MSPEQWMAAQQKKPMSPEEWMAMQSAQQPESKSMLGAIGAGIGQGVGNVALGAQNLLGKGFESIGAERAGQWLQQDAMEGKQRLAQEAAPYAEQFPMATGGGRLAGEIAGTLPVGGALAKGVSAIPGMMQKAAPLVQALRTSGASGGNLATRSAAGATVGGASGALINPDEATTGAAIGGAIPGVGALLRAGVQVPAKVLGATTGAGEEPIKQAFMAGKEGGVRAQALRENMRGQADILDVLDSAKANLSAMRQARGDAYRSNMAAVKDDKSVLDLAPIDQSIINSLQKFTFKGQARNPQVMQALQDVKGLVDNWKQLNPAEYHTPEGLDALKQQIGSYINKLPMEARDVKAALVDVEKSVKSQIQSQAPEYAKAMREYSQASDTIDEITRSLSQNDRASADTALRKLQSVMRNNANTNYGARLQSVADLESTGGRPLMPALAGQALNEWTPRGLQRAGAAATGGGLAFTGNLPAALGIAATSSPRLAGEGAFLAGQAALMGSNVVNPAIVEALRRGVYTAAPVVGVSQ